MGLCLFCPKENETLRTRVGGYGSISRAESFVPRSSRNTPILIPGHDDLDITTELRTRLHSYEPIDNPTAYPSNQIIQQPRRVVIATWNLLNFTLKKAETVKYEISDIIIKNKIDILAIQEIAEKNALDALCAELARKGPNDGWKCQVSERAGRMFRSPEYLGFVYKSSNSISITKAQLLTSDKSFARSPFMAIFNINNTKILIVNVHLKATGLSNQDIDRTRGEVDLLAGLIECIRSAKVQTSGHAMFVGDFNLSNQADFQHFLEGGFQNVVPQDMPTNISLRNPRGSKNYDNIWVALETIQKFYQNKFGVIRDDLTQKEKLLSSNSNNNSNNNNNVVIEPVISDHCPVWAEFRF